MPDELSLFPLFLFESVVARVNDSPHPHTVLASSRSKPTGVAAALRSSTSSDRRLLQETQRGRSPLASFRLKLVNRWQSFRRLTDVTEAGNAPSPPKCERVRRSVPPSSVGRSSTPPPSPPLSWGGTGRGRARSLARSPSRARGQVANGRRRLGRRIVMSCINGVPPKESSPSRAPFPLLMT